MNSNFKSTAALYGRQKKTRLFFMKHKSKAERTKLLADHIQKESAIELALQFSRKRFKRFDEIIEKAAALEDLSDWFADARISTLSMIFREYDTAGKTTERFIIRDCYHYLNRNSILLKGPEHIRAVHKIIRFRAYWHRELEKWEPRSGRSDQQLKDLATFLFCKYPVPLFLHKAFLEETTDQYIHWFIHLGNGRRAKDILNFPIPYTNKMYHWFLLAPEKFTIMQAVRWAQVKGLAGSDRLAERVAWSWLSARSVRYEEFWTSFLMLVCQDALFNPDKLTELTDYLRAAKREDAAFEIKGRTLNTLIRRSDEWHRRHSSVTEIMEWDPCSIEGFSVERENERLVMEELTSTMQLADEGIAMRHCVASYAWYCKKGRTAIFSLRTYAMNVLLTRIATIEVDLHNKRIAQAKGRLNSKIEAGTRALLVKWAGNKGLGINPHL